MESASYGVFLMARMAKFSALAASTALVLTGFSPAMAAPMYPGTSVATPIEAGALGWSADNENAQGWRSYRGNRGYRGHRHRGGIDGGDLLAGILVIGGIAAIASAASNNSRDRRYEDRDYRSENQRYDDRSADRRDDSRYDRGTGDMESAINACSSAAERQAGRDARVSAIESVARDGDGWRVEGELSNSEERSFLCGATEGRVDFVQVGNGNLAFAQ